MSASPILQYRARQASLLPAPTGVYALCDLDEVPIYVGQSVDGIRARVRRHLTSARSDTIANRQVDVWEIAFVWAWPCENRGIIDPLEAFLFHEFDSQSRLMNGTIPRIRGTRRPPWRRSCAFRSCPMKRFRSGATPAAVFRARASFTSSL